MEENIRKAYAVIFKELFPSHIQNIIEEHPEYESNTNNTLKIMNSIARSIHEPIQETYPYMSLTESLARIINSRQQEKEEFLQYMERFKQEKSIVKNFIREDFLDGLVKTTK